MRLLIQKLTLGAALAFAAVSFAQAPTSAPAGATGLCKDGTYSTGATKRGACRGHKGVKDWYGDSSAGASSSATPAAAAPATAAAPSAAAAPAPATPAAKANSSAAAATTPAGAAAAGGGPGLVWVNSSTKVYHCQGDRWYGKTKQGEYMTEANAKAQNFRPDHGKACQ